MAKKAKYTLSLEPELDFQLIGISCHQTDYRVCWALNLQLGLKMTKAQEPFMVSGKKGVINSSHSLYEWEDEDNFVSYHLIKNKENNKFLLPDQSQLDYFFVIKGGNNEIDDLVTQIKEIKGILTAVNIDPLDLRSNEHLIF
jgi:hypothetical protein